MRKNLKIVSSFLLIFVMCFGLLVINTSAASYDFTASDYYYATNGEAPTIRYGSTGLAVYDLQWDLQRIGFYTAEADGIFGPKTEAAVKALQRAITSTSPNTYFYTFEPITADGICGRYTWGKVQLMLYGF